MTLWFLRELRALRGGKSSFIISKKNHNEGPNNMLSEKGPQGPKVNVEPLSLDKIAIISELSNLIWPQKGAKNTNIKLQGL